MWSVANAPRKLQIFHPDNGGDVLFEDIGEPLEIDEQTGLPEGGESLVVKWRNPNSQFALQKKFYCNFDVFLAASGGGTPPNNEPISRIPDEQLLASCSMAAILAGEVHPGTFEFLNQIASDQNEKNFQSILGDVKIKSVSLVPESQLQSAQFGKFYDLEFMRLGQASNVKVVRSDIVEISKYKNRSSDFSLSIYNAPGAITANFGKKTVADLGSAESQLRQDIIAWLKSMRFYC